MHKQHLPQPRRWARLVFRTVVTIETMLGLAQALLAGEFLSGHYHGLSAHAQAPTGPPGPRVEAPPPSPAPDAVWLAGHWDWRGNAWVWQAGHWEKSQGRFYIPGRYRQTPQGWVYEPGRWQH